MKLEELIKEAFSKGWNSSHDCATNHDYDVALNDVMEQFDKSKKELIRSIVEELKANTINKLVYCDENHFEGEYICFDSNVVHDEHDLIYFEMANFILENIL